MLDKNLEYQDRKGISQYGWEFYFTISDFFMIVGGLGGIYGIIAKLDSKKVQEDKAQVILETTLKTMMKHLNQFVVKLTISKRSSRSAYLS